VRRHAFKARELRLGLVDSAKGAERLDPRCHAFLRQNPVRKSPLVFVQLLEGTFRAAAVKILLGA
jgi:hypothetical protein